MTGSSSIRLDSKTLRKSRAAPNPPPRLYGDPGSDTPALQEWMQQIHTALRDSGLGDPEYQFAEVEIDPANPPDPTLTTLYRAQATANLALAKVLALVAARETGSFTIADAATITTVTLKTKRPDTKYRVVASAVSSTGAPASGAFTVKGVTKAADSFVVTLSAAPGAGTSVTFDFFAE